ncbi:hypothetical protein FRC12_003766 [Ceratobasidium sp. 428]|nr:hypothetical protein FRC12_003766 [Ceratobasidium sp. 428]
MTACISPRPFTAETPAFDRSWADIKPSGTVVRAADVATRPHQPYPSSSSSASSSALVESAEPGRLINDRTSWFSAKTAVWDPRILLNAVKGPSTEYTLHKAVEWGTKCNSDLSTDEKVDNVLRFLAHAVGLQTAIDTSSSQSSHPSRSSHSRCDSAWSSVSEASLSTSPNSDSASLVDFRCDTPVLSSRPSGSPSPSIRSYCMAEPDEEDREFGSVQSSLVLPEITSLSNSLCYSESSERDHAMEELRDIVRRAILAVEADEDGPLGLAELHAAARDISYARRSSDEGTSTPPITIRTSTPPAKSTPPSSDYSKPSLMDSAVLESAIRTPLIRPSPAPRQSSPAPDHLPLLPPAPATPRSKSGKLYKPRPVFPDDPIPLQTFSGSPSSSPRLAPSPGPDQCRSQTPRAQESDSPTWSHSLLKPFGLKLDVHMLTDAISGLGIRKPMSPGGTPKTPSPVESPIENASPTEAVRARMIKRASTSGSEWQYLRYHSGGTDDTPVLATPIDEWYLPQFTPATEYNEWKDHKGSK